MKNNCCKLKNTPRTPEMQKNLITRLNRIEGQVNGIKKMLEENRYCGDILIQLSAIEKGLENFGYIILQDHMNTCMTEEIKNGNKEITKEAIELIKYLK
ncbi:MAG: metal-sensing transcriptional repressor [Ruminococcaceae bacterium]|nr:metal-sensing transcriptional repressor [Oscillospiraceae bacterium]